MGVGLWLLRIVKRRVVVPVPRLAYVSTAGACALHSVGLRLVECWMGVGTLLLGIASCCLVVQERGVVTSPLPL